MAATPPTIPYVFVYDDWVQLFPEMAGVSQQQAEAYFAIATTYVRNDGGGPVRSAQVLATALNFTTAHVAKLFSQQTNGRPDSNGAEPPAGIVGRIASATEGSVSVSAEMPDQPPAAAWWQQTLYGAAAWKLLAPYRTMRYLPGPRRRYNPPVRFWGGWNGGWGI